jgi:hypothetical protein
LRVDDHGLRVAAVLGGVVKQVGKHLRQAGTVEVADGVAQRGLADVAQVAQDRLVVERDGRLMEGLVHAFVEARLPGVICS